MLGSSNYHMLYIYLSYFANTQGLGAEFIWCQVLCFKDDFFPHDSCCQDRPFPIKQVILIITLISNFATDYTNLHIEI